MKRKKLKEGIVLQRSSIKKVMQLIDHSGLRVAYIVDKNNKLIGAVSDSEIRKAILKGRNIRESVKKILNSEPVVLRKKELINRVLVKKQVKKLWDRMPDSRYILVLDEQDRPLELMSCADLIQQDSIYEKSHRSTNQNVLVVGGAGYLGSVLVRKLLTRGFRVKVLDVLMFGIQPIEKLLEHERFKLVKGDMRNISTLTQALIDVDAVINLAAIVGDPACQTTPETTIETNYLANKTLAEACKYHQINRFVFASSCSIYGIMEKDKKVDEEAPLNPVSLYARTKIQSEEGILSLVDENFSPTILRMGTLYGYSPRMRFDLVVNTMTKTAIVDKKILVHGGGKQWRPLLHVEDAAEAYAKCLEAPIAQIKGEVFNVGSREQNYQVIQIAKLVNKGVPKAKIVLDGEASDPRNYSVSFAKVRRILKYKVQHGIVAAVTKIKKAIKDKEIKDVDNPKYYNVENML